MSASLRKRSFCRAASNRREWPTAENAYRSRAIPKSGNRFSDKITRKQNVSGAERFNLNGPSSNDVKLKPLLVGARIFAQFSRRAPSTQFETSVAVLATLLQLIIVFFF
jgi:hypothetical protein